MNLKGHYSETWKVEAASEEEARELVLRGEGDWIEGNWDDDSPRAEVVTDAE